MTSHCIAVVSQGNIFTESQSVVMQKIFVS